VTPATDRAAKNRSPFAAASRPTRAATSTPSGPTVVTEPPFGDGSPPSPPIITRALAVVSMPKRVVAVAPGKLFVYVIPVTVPGVSSGVSGWEP
jgi:hypothetical protein